LASVHSTKLYISSYITLKLVESAELYKALVCGDAWFSSVNMVSHLKSHGTDYIGIMKNRDSYYPYAYLQSLAEDLEDNHIRSVSFKTRLGVTIYASVWMNGDSPRFFIHSIPCINYVEWTDAKGSKYTRPDIVHRYYATSKAIDNNNQIISYQGIDTINTTCWYKRYFFGILATCMSNAYYAYTHEYRTLQKKGRPDLPANMLTSLQFLRVVALKLLKADMGEPNVSAPPHSRHLPSAVPASAPPARDRTIHEIGLVADLHDVRRRAPRRRRSRAPAMENGLASDSDASGIQDLPAALPLGVDEEAVVADSASDAPGEEHPRRPRPGRTTCSKCQKADATWVCLTCSTTHHTVGLCRTPSCLNVHQRLPIPPLANPQPPQQQ
jgi:hypothetical protein